MTTGTKIFLAVFALIVGILVVYYGMANGGGTPTDNKVADAGTSRTTGDGADESASPSRDNNVDRGNAPPPRQANPITPDNNGLHAPVSASRAGGLLSEGVREAAGEPVTPNAFLPLMGLNTPSAAPEISQPPTGEVPTGNTAGVPSANQPSVLPVLPQPKAAPSPTRDEPRALRIEHIIKSGDTYTSIAQDWFGDGTKWTLIAKENPTIDPARLKVGQKIYLPPKDVAVAVAPRVVAEPEIVPAEGELIYTVREGDSLSSIARQHYDDPGKWKDIYDLNRKAIGNDAGTLKVGMKLRLKMVKRS